MRTTMAKGIEYNNKWDSMIFWHVAGAIFLSLHFSLAQAAELKLQSIDFTPLSSDNLQVQLTLSGPAPSPRVFNTVNPARIALDLPGVGNELEKKLIPVNLGGAQSIQAVEASGRTRVIVNLVSMLPYTSRVEGNKIYVTLKNAPGSSTTTPVSATPSLEPVVTRPQTAPSPRAESAYVGKHVEHVDFRRGENGEGRLLITLSDPSTVANVREEGRRVVVTLPGNTLPPNLAQRLDVQDFATPVQAIESSMEANQAKFVILPASGEYDFSSYQSGKLLTVELRPLTKAEKAEIKKRTFAYGGEKLSLNFQDIPVRSVLQILADFTNLNIVASDTVQGNVTLRLNDVPWDQALELVLKSKGLGKRQEGNIIRVAPLDEINKLEKDDLEAQKTIEELEPLKTELIQIKYAKADDILRVLVGRFQSSSSNQFSLGSAGGAGVSPSASGSTSTTGVTATTTGDTILTKRGSATLDRRTNTLIIKETPSNLDKIKELIYRLDIPVRQVLIESRVVIANNDYLRELGSKFAINHNQRNLNITSPSGTDQTKQSYSGSTIATTDALVNLAAQTNPAATAGFTLINVGNYLLDLELSAAQQEGRGEVLSNPRLITTDQTKATIKQGVEIPYQVQTASGGGLVSNIQFKQAVLELTVTPHITPDDNILMELLVKKDAQGQNTAGGPAIDKREIETNAQVSNGDTVVLGGVYENTKSTTTNKVPFFGDLPGIGFMFRDDLTVDQKKELLIFITPKILKPNLGAR